jgi:GNAT superfamily N-acetyltransferase
MGTADETGEARIRPARLEDSGEVARLSAQFADYLRSLGDECPGPLTEEAYRRDGFGSDRSAPITMLIDFFVDPAMRRHGIGRRLIEAVAKEARAGGSIELVWAVYRANGLAYAFYESLGAEHITDLTLMRLRLK